MRKCKPTRTKRCPRPRVKFGKYKASTPCTHYGFFIDAGSLDHVPFVERFEFEGRPTYVRNGYEGTSSPDLLEWCVVWTDAGGFGWGWHISGTDTNVLYFSPDDVATPDLATNWIAVEFGGEEPVPGIGALQCMDQYI